MTAARSRDFDLVLLGATGFVGRLTAQHLASQAPPGVRVALAGRSPERLAAVRQDLPGSAARWPLVTVDVSDDRGVAALAANTRVVLSTVGPYLRHGLPLVRACAAAGTDYADLTGETLFVRRSIHDCHVAAQQTGARIVHSCGFDSVPSDLGVGLAAALAMRDGHRGLGRTVLHVRSMRGGISGGTVDSLRQQLLEVSGRPDLRSVVSDPFSLADSTQQRRSGAGGSGPRSPVTWDPLTGTWLAPFVMGGFNRQIVHRTDALEGDDYGTDFRYREVVDTGSGGRGVVGAVAMVAGSTALMAGMSVAPTRRLLDRVLPKPGEGPSERTRRAGRFLVEVVAETDGPSYVTTVGASLDPGYGATAVMLGESGLALALDELPTAGGVLTPMTALGESLARRLRGQGFTLSTQRRDA